MKYKLATLTGLMLASLAPFASGASVFAINYDGSDSSVVLDLDSNQISNGFAAVGYFSILDADIPTSNSTDLATAFQIFGAPGNTSYEVGGGYFMDGAFSFTASGATPLGNPFIGQNIYLVVGNQSTLDTSTEAFIYKTNTLFPADPASPITLDFTAGAPAGSLIMGATGITFTPVFDDGVNPVAGNEVTTNYQTAAIIPEPSVALLGAFGILALLRRRR